MSAPEQHPRPGLSPPSLQALTIPGNGAEKGKGPPKADGPDVVKSPVPSFASRDSFATALTSPSQVTLDNPDSPTASTSQSIFHQPASLRKSLSVDSFVQYGRDHLPTTTRPNRGHTSSALEPPKGLLFDPTQKLDRDRRSAVGRSRGASVSSVTDDRAASVVGESDVERSDILNSPIDGYNRIFAKGQEKGKPLVSGGELPLPSRTPALSTTSSMSSILTASTSSSTQEGVPRMQSTSPLQSMARKA